jgi:Ca2+-binding RTX toxin-like protein
MNIYGTSGTDLLYGGDGNDTLYGYGEGDDLSGGNGNDILVGGAGADGYVGGAGADRFQMNSSSEANGDWIHDFSQSDGDKIDVSQIDAVANKWWNPWTLGEQGFNFIHTSNFTGTAGELRYFHTEENTYVQGSTDSDTAAEFTIGLKGIYDLKFWDFGL